MAVDHLEIYRSQAQQYEDLVAREDYRGQIWRTLQEICSWDDQVVFDLGTGTGRLMKILLPVARFVCGFDASADMLEVAWEGLARYRKGKWDLVLANHRQIPVAEGSADRLVSGWSLAYLALNQGPEWREIIQAAFDRYYQILRPGGVMVILETMGTGFTEPNPPEKLLDYYTFLENSGFQSTWIRTDYRFRSVSEAVERIKFFFGEELAREVQREKLSIVPECTGIWWKNL